MKEPGGEQARGERARGRISQGANEPRGEPAKGRKSQTPAPVGPSSTSAGKVKHDLWRQLKRVSNTVLSGNKESTKRGKLHLLLMLIMHQCRPSICCCSCGNICPEMH